jgi:small subunit ribosomal protein S1
MDQNDAQIGQEALPEDNQPEGKNLEDQTITPPSMEELIEEEGLKLDFPKQGEIRTGVIASIGEAEILVSIGTKSEGVIKKFEIDKIPKDELDKFEVGKDIPVYVVNPEDEGGTLVLSFMRAKEEQDWITAEEMMETNAVFEGAIESYNKGGLLVPFGTLRGFVPASQVSVMRRMESVGDTPDERWKEMVGGPIKVRVIEVDRERHRLILSERLALQETRESIKDRLMDELQEGIICTGRVTSLAEFGAFVNIEGADGLVHLSEISWDRLDHPNEVLEIGQEVQVKVISIDQERKRIGLSIRQLLPDPWTKKVEGLREGQLVQGEVTHLTKFGAFARLNNQEDLEGLIHISELSETRINHPKEVVKEGDVVTLRVIRIDTERRRIGLSLRKVDSPAYADLDWKIALSDEVEESKLHEQETPIDLEESSEVGSTEAELPEEVSESETEKQVSTDAEEPEADEEVILETSAEQVMETAEEEVILETSAEQVMEAAEEEVNLETSAEQVIETAEEEVNLETSAEQVMEAAEEEVNLETSTEQVMEAAEEEVNLETSTEQVMETAEEEVNLETSAEQVMEAAEEEVNLETSAEQVLETAEEEEETPVEVEEQESEESEVVSVSIDEAEELKDEVPSEAE